MSLNLQFSCIIFNSWWRGKLWYFTFLKLTSNIVPVSKICVCNKFTPSQDLYVKILSNNKRDCVLKIIHCRLKRDIIFCYVPKFFLRRTQKTISSDSTLLRPFLFYTTFDCMWALIFIILGLLIRNRIRNATIHCIHLSSK